MNRTLAVLGAVIVTGMAANSMASPYSDAVIALGPDAYWRMQDTAGVGTDEVGNAHPMANFNNVTRGADGPSLPGMEVNQLAYDLGGAAGANTNNNPYVPVSGTGARTGIIWAKIDTSMAPFGGDNSLMSYGPLTGGANTFTGWKMRVAGGWNSSTGQPLGYEVFALNIQGREVQATTTPIGLGQWHMFAAVFPAGLTQLGDAQLYVDGVPQTLINDIGAVPNTDGSQVPMRIGQAYGDWGLDGQLTEAAFFTRGLSAAEIQGLYNAAVPEPAAAALLGLVMAAACTARRRT